MITILPVSLQTDEILIISHGMVLGIFLWRRLPVQTRGL